MRQRSAYGVQRSLQVDRDDAVDLVVGVLVDAAGEVDAGVADEHVERWSASTHCATAARTAALSETSAASTTARWPSAQMAFATACASVAIDVNQRHRRTFAGESLGGRSADAPRGAGDEHDAAGELQVLIGHDSNRVSRGDEQLDAGCRRERRLPGASTRLPSRAEWSARSRPHSADMRRSEAERSSCARPRRAAASGATSSAFDGRLLANARQRARAARDRAAAAPRASCASNDVRNRSNAARAFAFRAVAEIANEWQPP